MKMYGFGVGEFVIASNDFVAIFSSYPEYRIGDSMDVFTEYSEKSLCSFLKEPNTPEKQIIKFFGSVENFKKSDVKDEEFFKENFPEFFL